jgi:hypothetical protein
VRVQHLIDKLQQHAMLIVGGLGGHRSALRWLDLAVQDTINDGEDSSRLLAQTSEVRGVH